MSKLAYYTDFVSIPTLILILLASGPIQPAIVLLGFLTWTYVEYVIHRNLFHAVPLFKPGHDEHHAKPWARTGVTSWHSLLVFAVLALVLPFDFLAGFCLGYLGYICLHHVVHHWRVWPGHPLYALKIRHTVHHRGVEANFGVTTTVWDRVYGTYIPFNPRR